MRHAAILIAMLILLACILPVTVTAESKVVDERGNFEEFIELLQEGSYQRAIDLYETHQETYEHSTAVPAFSAYAEYAKGLLRLEEGRLEEALTCFVHVQELMLVTEERRFPEEEDLYSCMALIDYTRGRISETVQAYQEAADLYGALVQRGEIIMDVISRRNHCLYLITPIQERYILTSHTADSNSITISWADREAGADGSYEVSWWPVGTNTAQHTTASSNETVIQGLLPGTEYQIMLMHQLDDKKSPLFSNITTAAAPSLRGSIKRASRMKMMTYPERKSYMTYQELLNAGYITSCDVTETKEAIVLVDRNYAEGENRYLLYIDIENSDTGKASANCCVLMRMPDNLGVYASQTTIEFATPNESGKSVQNLLLLQLTDVLEQYFVDHGSTWIESTGSVELYLDDMYVDEVPICILLN